MTARLGSPENSDPDPLQDQGARQSASRAPWRAFLCPFCVHSGCGTPRKPRRRRSASPATKSGGTSTPCGGLADNLKVRAEKITRRRPDGANGAGRHSPVSADEAWARIRGRRDWPPRLEPMVLIRAGVPVLGSDGVICLTLRPVCTQGAARIRTGDRGFAVLCLTTWPRRRMENGEARLLCVEPPHGSERETGLEPATPTLARWCSTN
jgi:hypothetical protein